MISVVVPTRDRSGRLDALLLSLSAQALPPGDFEVVVVDDGSRDATPQVLAEASERLPYRLTVVSGEGRGPASARNLGWRASAGELVAFTDDDCEADAGWLAAVAAAAQETPDVVIQGRTTPIPRERDRLGLLARTKLIETEGPWYQTCNIVYPRALLERLDGFDERFTRPFGEDVDLAWRAIESGARVRFVAAALVHHAVESLDPAAYLRDAMRDPDEALIFKRHPALRRRVARLGIFKSEAHALLVVAAIAFAACPRSGLLRWAPAVAYGLHAAARVRASGAAPVGALPLVAARDAIELAQATRGAVRHRVPLV